eukprot:Polyplicarium_translucidae@DN4762_c0_g1_i1.p1
MKKVTFAIVALAAQATASVFESQLFMTEEEFRSRFKEVMLRIDTDKDGAVSRLEAIGWLDGLTVHAAMRAIVNEFQSIDSDHNGFVTVDELMAAYEAANTEQQPTESLKDHINSRFRAADLNQDSALTLREMAFFAHPVSSPEVLRVEAKDVMQIHDENNNSAVDFEEFLKQATASDPDPDEKNEETYRKEFEAHDTDGDGKLSVDEVYSALLNPHKRQIEAAVQSVFDVLANAGDIEDANADNMLISAMEEHAEAFIASPLLDMGELVRFPETYNFEPPFTFMNVKGAEPMAFSEDDLDFDDIEGEGFGFEEDFARDEL